MIYFSKVSLSKDYLTDKYKRRPANVDMETPQQIEDREFPFITQASHIEAPFLKKVWFEDCKSYNKHRRTVKAHLLGSLLKEIEVIT